MSVGFRMVIEVNRPSNECVQRFVGMHSCDISDVVRGAGTMSGIAPVYVPVQAAVGVAVTVSIPTGGVNLVKLAMEQTRPGDILVVSAYGATATAVWGGNLTRGLKARGVVGLIVDGAVRDVSEMRALQLPVFARGVASTIGPVATTAGEINVPIACGGAVVNPGDIVVADEDGIAVVAPADSDEIVAGVAALTASHAAAQPILLRGEVTQIASITADFMSSGLELRPRPDL